ncbi:DUF6284 family protein [Streptomyces jeddahensis]|uniref:Uncharacterized protein n=1 Tax=Streptomyces jeddahensis TaxID=1716141 RepID=A0A177HKN1_9ACTN|nr:DUF6284 family protein [Streptomyces jeddahensis]OAH11316.1 hypothetical protein STSP_52640 [Streptomyces jeddahensis]
MKLIVAVQEPVTGDLADAGPSWQDLHAIELERPLIDAEMDLLDVEIALLARPVSELDQRRLRRATNKVLAARVEVANRLGAGEAA